MILFSSSRKSERKNIFVVVEVEDPVFNHRVFFKAET
jgi:hypothetical protein